MPLDKSIGDLTPAHSRTPNFGITLTFTAPTLKEFLQHFAEESASMAESIGTSAGIEKVTLAKVLFMT